jgi:hypothetical protein
MSPNSDILGIPENRTKKRHFAPLCSHCLTQSAPSHPGASSVQFMSQG